MIPDELSVFLESGLSIVVATRDGELQPNGAVAWALSVHDDRAHVSVFLHPDAAKEMLENLGSYPQIALDLDLPTSHRACQLKGLFVSARKARAPERAEVERQLEAFSADLAAIGIPRALTAGWSSWPCTVLKVRVTDLFEQTPGPGAGDRLP